MLEEAHKCVPSINLSAYFDDIVVDAIGPSHLVGKWIAKAVLMLKNGLARLKLRVSSKSTCIATNKTISNEVRDMLSEDNVSIVSAALGKDLGVGTTAGLNRQAAMIELRLSRARHKAFRASKLASWAKAAGKKRRRLSGQGVFPAAYGITAIGLSPRQMQSLRTSAVISTGTRGKQQCVATTIAVELGSYADPCIRQPTDVILQWLHIKYSDNYNARSASRAWTIALAKMRPKQTRWKLVTGPLQATIATLLDLNWNPLEPDHWVDAMGEHWHTVPEPGVPLTRQAAAGTLHAIRAAALDGVWVQARAHRHGHGIEGPPDLDIVHKLHAKYLAQHSYAEAGMLKRIVAGGLWPQARVHTMQVRRQQWCAAKGFQYAGNVSAKCVLCGASSQCEMHTAWECPRILQHANITDLDLGHLIREAKPRENPALWTRGLNSHVYSHIPDPPAQGSHVHRITRGKWLPGTYYSDASGGPNAKDPKLRRVAGAGLNYTMLHDSSGIPSPKIDNYLEASLPGEQQTINRGELYMVLLILEAICPIAAASSPHPTTVHTDSQYVIDGVARPSACHGFWHGDLWHALFAAIKQLGGRVIILKSVCTYVSGPCY